MWRFLIRLLQLPLALIVMFYEWGWETLGHVFDWLARRPLWKAMEDAIRRLPPWAALVVFALFYVSCLSITWRWYAGKNVEAPC